MSFKIDSERVRGDDGSTDSAAYPEELDTFLRLVRQHVQEHTNPDSRLGAGDYARFGAFMATHGLSPSTAWAAARQLARERGGRFGSHNLYENYPLVVAWQAKLTMQPSNLPSGSHAAITPTCGSTGPA